MHAITLVIHYKYCSSKHKQLDGFCSGGHSIRLFLFCQGTAFYRVAALVATRSRSLKLFFRITEEPRRSDGFLLRESPLDCFGIFRL